MDAFIFILNFLGTLNFKNFISECYLNQSQLSVLDFEDMERFIAWLDKLTDLTMEEQGTVNAICQLLQ